MPIASLIFICVGKTKILNIAFYIKDILMRSQFPKKRVQIYIFLNVFWVNKSLTFHINLKASFCSSFQTVFMHSICLCVRENENEAYCPDHKDKQLPAISALILLYIWRGKGTFSPFWLDAIICRLKLLFSWHFPLFHSELKSLCTSSLTVNWNWYNFNNGTWA